MLKKYTDPNVLKVMVALYELTLNGFNLYVSFGDICEKCRLSESEVQGAHDKYGIICICMIFARKDVMVAVIKKECEFLLTLPIGIYYVTGIFLKIVFVREEKPDFIMNEYPDLMRKTVSCQKALLYM